MEGLGEGYEAFLERLQSDFSVSKPSSSSSSSSHNATKSSPQNSSPNSFVSGHLLNPNPNPNPNPNQDIVGSNKPNRGGFASHLHLPPPKKYVGYPSPANAFTVKKDESSSSPSESSIRPASRTLGDVSKDEKASPVGFPPPISRTSSSDFNRISSAPSYHRGHRRAQSEIDFRLPDDIVFDFEPGGLEASAEADELADDFISALDLEKMNILDAFSSKPATRHANKFNPVPSVPHHSRSFSVDQMFTNFNSNEDSFGHAEEAVAEKPRHRHSHSHSIDGSTTSLQKEPSLTTADSSKSVSANKLAELALIDPKRAKRILANRQSAARSKERKMRYIAELERKVQALQTEATALSAQLTIMQNDTTVLTAENNELKFQLKTLEQQTHLSNALNITLKEEVQRLKIATGEVANNGQFYRSQPITDTLLSSQQLQQIRSALQKHQIINHQNIL